MSQQTEQLRCDICQSADKELEEYMGELPYETSFHRVEGQSVKCAFGLLGTCCRLCANGPCRIVPGGERGICGADADTIVVRGFLRAVASGSGCYIHVVENAVKNLRKTALARGTFASVGALERLASILGIGMKENIYDTALAIADTIREDLYRESDDRMFNIRALSLPQRYEVWKRIELLPGGAKAEVFDGAVKTSTNLSSDPEDMLLHCLRLGISTGIYGLKLSNLISDILIGEPEIHFAPVGLQVIDPGYINIMVTGHQEILFNQIMKAASSPEGEAAAVRAGAKGFRVVGCTCVGQDMQQRAAKYRDVYAGTAGNNFVSEAVLSTGAIDGVISEFNCTLPGIENLCATLDVEQICIDKMAKKRTAELIPYNFETAVEDAEKILDKIAEKYKTRRSKVEIRLPRHHGNRQSMAGLSELSLKKFLGGAWKPLLELIISGKVRGIAGVVGCSSLDGGHDVLTEKLVRELIKKDILVLSAGCTSGGLSNCGLMEVRAAGLAGESLSEVCLALGIPPVLNFGSCLAIGRLEMVAEELADELAIDISQLPLVLSAAQWLEEQALADGAYGLALGLTLHLGKAPFVAGSPLAVEVLTKQMEGITGGRLILQEDGCAAARQLEEVIMQKRKALNI